MTNCKLAITLILISWAAFSFGQIEITNDKISNLEVVNSGFLTLYGNIKYDSYGHNFLINGTEVFDIDNLGINMQSSARITRKQPMGFNVDLLPYAYGKMTHAAGSDAILTHDTGNFAVEGDEDGIFTITFTDGTVVTGDLVVQATPITTGSTFISQCSLSFSADNTMRVSVRTPSGDFPEDYGATIVVYKP